VAGPVLAADTVTVDAQVSIVAPCITVSTTSIDFGQLSFSTQFPATSTRDISYANCSGAEELVFARGTDATEADGGPATWLLTDPQNGCPDDGPNSYILDLLSSDGRSAQRLLTTDRQVDTVATGSSGLLDEVKLWAPCEGSDGAGETMSFQIIFTATF
jgi:hypothetical protein